MDLVTSIVWVFLPEMRSGTSMRLCVALAWPLSKDDQLCRWDIICHPVSNCTTGQLPVQLFSPWPSGTVPCSPRKISTHSTYRDFRGRTGTTATSETNTVMVCVELW